MFRRQLLFFSACFLLFKPLLAFQEIGDANDENHVPDEVIGLSHHRPSEIGDYNCVCGFTTWRCCRRNTGKRQLSKVKLFFVTSQTLQLFLCTYRVVNIVNKSLFSMKRTSVSWEITSKWQSHCFLSNKFGRQALHQNWVTDEKTELRKTIRLSLFPNSQVQFASLSFTFVPPVGTSSSICCVYCTFFKVLSCYFYIVLN